MSFYNNGLGDVLLLFALYFVVARVRLSYGSAAFVLSRPVFLQGAVKNVLRTMITSFSRPVVIEILMSRLFGTFRS